MRDELLDKEVLCLYDIRQIQRFLFKLKGEQDIAGADYLVKHLLPDAISWGLNHVEPRLGRDHYCLDPPKDTDGIPYFHDAQVLAQSISSGGGNNLMLYRSGRLCRQVNRLVSRYVLDHGYSLEIAMCAVEKTDDISFDTNKLYEELDKIKFSLPSSQPLCALPIVQTEAATGYPAVERDRDTGEYLSQETLLKRQAAKTISSPCGPIGGSKHPSPKSRRGLLAFVQMDGNRMGASIQKILGQVCDYEEGIHKRHRVDKNIHDNYSAAVAETEEWLRGKLGCAYAEGYQRISVGGDDINIACAPQYALSFVEHFIRNISQRCLWDDEPVGRIPFSVCAGIAYINVNAPLGKGLELAEQCCASAKTRAKKEALSVNGGVGNWVDFHICRDLHPQNLDVVRKKSYTLDDHTSLLMRPYCLDEEFSGSPTR